MKGSDLAILDYSVHGNTIDAESDRLLALAARSAGLRASIRALHPDQPLRAEADRVWLRYDLRSRAELSWIVGLAQALRREGRIVFPPAQSILAAEDKWEAFHAFGAAQIPTPATQLAFAPGCFGFPAIVKPRTAWGGIGRLVLHGPSDLAGPRDLVAEDCIVQPYTEHTHMWIVAQAAGREIVVIEEGRGTRARGDARVVALPAGAAGLARAALDAVGLPTGTVDLIRSTAGMLVLEVNSAPRIPYPALENVDLAGPMVRAVLDWMEEGCPSIS